MAYFDLFLSCLFFAGQFVSTKLYGQRARDSFIPSLWNQTVMTAAMLLFLVLRFGFAFSFTGESILYALIFSSCTVINICFMLFAMNCGNISAVGVWCLTGGMVGPYVYGLLFLEEKTSLLKVIGMVLMGLSMIPALFRDRGSLQNGKRGRFALFNAIVFLSNAFICTSMVMQQRSASPVSEESFMVEVAGLRFLMTLVIFAVLAAVMRARGERAVGTRLFWDIGVVRPMTGKVFGLLILFAALCGVGNTLGNLFSLRCLLTLDASVQFPIQNEAVIVLTTLAGRILFKEKIDRGTAFSLLLSLGGIVAVALG